MPEGQEAQFKIVLVGEAAVGKTSLIHRYVRKSFSEEYLMTIGTNISKCVEVVYLSQRRPVRVSLVIWDIMGNRRIMDLLGDAFFMGASGALAVFDVTRRETLQALGAWMEITRHEKPEMPVTVLGNKADLEGQRAVLDEDAKAYCDCRGLIYLPSSAKTGLNVEEAFHHLAEKILAQIAALAE